MRIAACLLFLILIISCGQNKKDKSLDTPVSDTTNTLPTTGTTLTDLSNRYKVNFQAIPDSNISLEDNFKIAVIPVDSIGKLEIPWHGLMKEFTKITEKEFETELMQCIRGKDTGDNGVVSTTRLANYCEREGYSDWGGMGSYPIMYYGAFVKNNKLVIAEYLAFYSKCGIGYETKAEQDSCEARNGVSRESMRNFMNELVKTIVIVPKPAGSPDDNAAAMIGTPFKLGKLEVSEKNLYMMTSWDQGKSMVEGIGSGWRLPTMQELNEIYKNKATLGNFASDTYWSSDEANAMNARVVNFSSGKNGSFSKIYTGNIRAVRSL